MYDNWKTRAHELIDEYPEDNDNQPSDEQHTIAMALRSIWSGIEALRELKDKLDKEDRFNLSCAESQICELWNYSWKNEAAE